MRDRITLWIARVAVTAWALFWVSLIVCPGVWTPSAAAASIDSVPTRHSRSLEVDPNGELVISGLPTYGADTTGADAYATVVTAPARQCHWLHVAVGGNGAVISLDGGATDHLAIPANTERLFPGLLIPASAAIQGRNLTAGSNYTNLRVSVW